MTELEQKHTREKLKENNIISQWDSYEMGVGS